MKWVITMACDTAGLTEHPGDCIGYEFHGLDCCCTCHKGRKANTPSVARWERLMTRCGIPLDDARRRRDSLRELAGHPPI